MAGCRMSGANIEIVQPEPRMSNNSGRWSRSSHSHIDRSAKNLRAVLCGPRCAPRHRGPSCRDEYEHPGWVPAGQHHGTFFASGPVTWIEELMVGNQLATKEWQRS